MTTKGEKTEGEYHLISKKDLAKLVGASLIFPMFGPVAMGGMVIGAKLGGVRESIPLDEKVSEEIKKTGQIPEAIWNENFRDILEKLLEDFEIDGEITEFERLLIKIIRRSKYSEEEQKTLAQNFDLLVDSIIRDRLDRPKIAPELWVDRDKSKKEKPHEFIERVYGSYIEAGTLLRADIRALDDPLNSALARQEKNPKKAPPPSFYLPKQQDRLADDPELVVKKGVHEGRQASAKSRWK